MKIAVFAGTSEGRRFSEALCENKIDHILCVATEYGQTILKESPHAQVMQGRMDEDEMGGMLESNGIEICFDITHPFATIVSENIRAACEKTGTEYVRVKREDTGATAQEATCFTDHGDCAKALLETKGSILLTTGSKDLPTYCGYEELRERLYARVLPSIESITICNENGLKGEHVIAMQGPFTHDMNVALIKALNIDVLVTKQSGKTGGFFEKISAADQTDTKVFIVGLPKEDEGISFKEALFRLGIHDTQKTADPKKDNNKIKRILLVGAGMGNDKSLTKEADAAIKRADHILGASRLIAPYETSHKTHMAYMPKDVFAYIEEQVDPGQVAVVLFSGDTGFYSGAGKLFKYLREERESAGLRVSIIPGQSSISQAAALLGESYEDAAIISIHGRRNETSLMRIREGVKTHQKTFVLISGVSEVREVYEDLGKNIPGARITAICNIGSPQEVVKRVDDESLKTLPEGLYILFIENKNWIPRQASGYVRDEEFIRDKVPMTKQAVRSLSIQKLCLREDSLLYDIGAGTGSISIEAALLSPDIRVYAVERKEEAVSLIHENLEKFGLDNVEVVSGLAPEALNDLPAPTHAFIGGSAGNLSSVMRVLYEKNPMCRVVANSVSFETLGEFLKLQEEFKFTRFEISQIFVANTHRVGGYNMQKAENPIWICEMEFDPQ